MTMTRFSVKDATHSPRSVPDPIRFPSTVLLTKAEAFSACQALADADRLLLRSGLVTEAMALGDLFELLEMRLASGGAPS